MLRGHHRFFSASWPGTASSHTHSPISAGPLPTSRPRKNERDHDRGGPIEGVGGYQAAPRVPRVGAAGRGRKMFLIAVDAPDAARAEGARDAHLDAFLSFSQQGPTSKAAVHDGLTALALAVRPAWRDHTARLLHAMTALGTKYVGVEVKGAYEAGDTMLAMPGESDRFGFGPRQGPPGVLSTGPLRRCLAQPVGSTEGTKGI